MSLISLVYPTKHIIYQNLGEIGEMPCPTLFGGYVERLLITPPLETAISFMKDAYLQKWDLGVFIFIEHIRKLTIEFLCLLEID